MILIKSISLSILVLAVSSANASIISWDSGDSNYIGLRDSSSGEVGCSGGDVCADTQTWDLGGGLSVTASAYWRSPSDPFEDRVLWHDANPAVGGLGGAADTELGDASQDNNQNYESIYISFSSAVNVQNLFFNGDHIAFEDNMVVHVNALPCGLGGICKVGEATGGVFAINELTSELWIEPDWTDVPIAAWYLSGVEYTSNNVPEPVSLFLLGFGMVGLGFLRTRKQS